MGRHSAGEPDDMKLAGPAQRWEPQPPSDHRPMPPCRRCGAPFAAHASGMCPEVRTSADRDMTQQPSFASSRQQSEAVFTQQAPQPHGSRAALRERLPGDPQLAVIATRSRRWVQRHLWLGDAVVNIGGMRINRRKLVAGLAIVVVVLIIIAELVHTSQQSSLSSQADAVMQLNDTPFDVTQSPGSQDIQVINSAEAAFNAAVTVTNDPTQQDTDYTNIAYDLGQVQQDIQDSDWVQYYNDLGNVRTDIQSARADGTLSGP